MNTQAIGIFDSGIGGTSIFKEIHALLPRENIIYLADSKNAPYGDKTKKEIIQLSIKNTELLISKSCKIIVIACNTATTNAISYLRTHYKLPFIGIEPAIKPAAIHTQTKAIGILATKGTLSSKLFHTTTNLHAQNINIIEQVGDGIVSLIEAGKLDSDQLYQLLLKYTKPMLKANIDYLVLGCTHYSYLIPTLTKILPKHVTIIDSGLAIAKQSKSILQANNLINTSNKKSKIQIYSNGKTSILNSILENKFITSYLNF